jgi:hypothetical protein
MVHSNIQIKKKALPIGERATVIRHMRLGDWGDGVMGVWWDDDDNDDVRTTAYGGDRARFAGASESRNCAISSFWDARRNTTHHVPSGHLASTLASIFSRWLVGTYVVGGRERRGEGAWTPGPG